MCPYNFCYLIVHIIYQIRLFQVVGLLCLAGQLKVWLVKKIQIYIKFCKLFTYYIFFFVSAGFQFTDLHKYPRINVCINKFYTYVIIWL